MQWGSLADWLQTAATVAVGLLAWRAFVDERRAVRVTQRADLLVDRVEIRDGDFAVVLTVKNFGPTRASNAQITLGISIEGSLTPGPPAEASPLVTIGAQDKFSCSFMYLYVVFSTPDATAALRGDLPLRFHASVRYDDVFGVTHLTACSGVWHARRQIFVVEENRAD